MARGLANMLENECFIVIGFLLKQLWIWALVMDDDEASGVLMLLLMTWKMPKMCCRALPSSTFAAKTQYWTWVISSGANLSISSFFFGLARTKIVNFANDLWKRSQKSTDFIFGCGNIHTCSTRIIRSYALAIYFFIVLGSSTIPFFSLMDSI